MSVQGQGCRRRGPGGAAAGRAAAPHLAPRRHATQRRAAYFGRDARVEGIVLESEKKKGVGIVLRVLVKDGLLRKSDHFVAGMIHGVVRSLRDCEGREIFEAVPGKVVDVVFANKSKHIDAPIESAFFSLSAVEAARVIEQR